MSTGVTSGWLVAVVCGGQQLVAGAITVCTPASEVPVSSETFTETNLLFNFLIYLQLVVLTFGFGSELPSF